MENATEASALIPDSFASTARKLMLEVVKEVQDAWAILSIEERERIEQRIDSQVTDLEGWLQSALSRAFDDYLANGRPYFVCPDDSIAIKEGEVKLVLKFPQSDAPDELYTHNGRFHVTLVEGQIDWVSQANRAQAQAEAA